MYGEEGCFVSGVFSTAKDCQQPSSRYDMRLDLENYHCTCWPRSWPILHLEASKHKNYNIRREPAGFDVNRVPSLTAGLDRQYSP